MAQSSWTWSLTNLFKKKVVDPARRPESYLKFSRRCLQKVRMKISPRDSKSSEVVNYNQCIYLVDNLDKTVQKASLFLEHNRHLRGNFMSSEDGTKSILEHFKILCMLAKKVQCFIQDCCNGHWLHTVVMLTDLSNCSASLGFDLKLFTVLLPPFSASSLTLSLDEVSAWRRVEGELVKAMASKDEGMLRALILSGQASNDDLELTTFLLERLDRFKQGLPILHERDLSNLKNMVQIGRGGYGTVHKASWLGIDVAIKTFHGIDNSNFKKEVPILASLCHPNIVSFLCHGKDMGECFIVMELMEQDLFSLLKERLRNDRILSSPFSVFEEFDIMLQIAEAMDYLHEMRVLHRDLKAQNILVRCMKPTNVEGYGFVQVKVSDFGLSRKKEYSMTQSHMTPNMGTTRWMAPELIKFQNTSDIRSIETAEDKELVKNFPFKCDVYSFGMVCLEILTGDVPFPNMTAYEVRTAVCSGDRPQLPNECHEKLKALIERCWSPNASSRPCFGEICTELRYLKSLHMTRKAQGSWIRTFNIADLRSVTGNFSVSNILDLNDLSVVHKGIFADGSKVAVTRVKGAVTRLGFKFIKLEVEGRMSARHPHLVEMLGYCIDGNDLLLVNEYTSQGTLYESLQVKYQARIPAKTLSRVQRLSIALDVTQALSYLLVLDSTFVHFDLNSSNVLLDDDVNAKVLGFWPSKSSADGSLRQGVGASGYIFPEYTAWGGWRTKANHVYSFGVVLMELLIGRPTMSKKQELVTWFRKEFRTKPVSAFQLITTDPHLVLGLNFHPHTSPPVKSFLAVAELAMGCTTGNPMARPDMDQVESVLRRLLLEESMPSCPPVGRT